LNHRLIYAPLEKAIQDIDELRKDAWERQRQENKSLWLAIRSHSHTEIPARERDKVLLPVINGTTNGAAT
jgi:hypothetical protein